MYLLFGPNHNRDFWFKSQAGSAALGAGSAAVRRTVAHLDGRQVVVDGSNHVRVVDALDEGKAISAIQVGLMRFLYRAGNRQALGRRS